MVGQSSSPFFRRVADQLSIDHPNGLPAWAAHLLDNSFFNDISRTTSAGVNAGLHAGLVNAGIGFAGSSGSPQAAAQGFISGSILGMAGGMVHTWRDFQSPGDVAQAQVGDRYRFMQSLDPQTKRQFSTYSPEAQLTLASAFTQHPDLRLDFNAPEGSGGMWKLDGDKRTATISIDPTAPDGAIPLILQHEMMHHIAAHGMGAELDAKMLGDPLTGQAGWFARRDANGKPIRNPDGSFQPNDDLTRMQSELGARYIQHGAPEIAAQLNPSRTIRELASEAAVGMISPGALQARASLSGKLLDAGTAPFVTKNFVKNAIATLGNGFDPQARIVGTGLFTGEKRIPILDSIINDWNNNRRVHSPLETGDSQTLLPKDFANKSDADIRAVTGPVDAWKMDGRGNIKRAMDGTPIMKTKKQMDEKSVEVGKSIHDTITNMSDDQRHMAGIRPNGKGGYILPSRLSGGLEKIAGKTLSPDGLRNLRTWTDLSSLDPNAALSVDYLGAYERNRFTRSPTPAGVPLKTHVISPLAVEVTKAGNLIGHSFDHSQLLENSALSARKETGKPSGFDSMAKIYSNARNLLELVSKGQPSESVYSPEQKRFLYENLGLDPKLPDGTNIFSDMAKSSRSQSIHKTLRLDRIRSAQIIPGNRLNVHNGTYDSLRAYKTTGRLALENYGTDVHPSAFGRGPDYSRAAAAITSQQAPLTRRTDLAAAGQNLVRDVMEPAVQPRQQPPPVPRAQPTSIQAQPAAPRALPASGVPRAQPLNIDRSISARAGSFMPGRGQMQVQKIVMHSTDGGSTQGDINTLTGHDPRYPASVHFYIERNGTIHQFVNTGDTAYQAGAHNSSGFNNNNTIGIEQQHVDGKDDWPAAQVKSAARLVAQQLRENPRLSINDAVGHSDIAPERKQDPVGYPWAKFRQLVQSDIGDTGQPSVVRPPVSRLGMGRRILGMETDLTNGLRVEQLPPGDRSGPGFEVGGITPRWDGQTASRLKQLVESGDQKQALHEAKEYIASRTDGVVNQWLGGSGHLNPGLEFAVRDIAFQHGNTAVQRILSRALGFNPRFLTPAYVEAAARQDPQVFLSRIRQARLDYVDLVQQPAQNLRAGVLNRVESAHEISSSL